mgnify:CR=1 FL=1
MMRLAHRPALRTAVLCSTLIVAATDCLLARESPTAVSRTLSELGVPASYAADRCVPTYQEASNLVTVGLDGAGRTQRLQPEAAAAWREMQRAAKSDGVTLLLVSAFRSVGDQRRIFERKLGAGQTLDAILAVNVPPGFSQHHTGAAVDLGTPGSTELLEDFEGTAAFRWLAAHAHAYGFSPTYPRGNSAGLAYEPWHWAFGQDEESQCFTVISRRFHARLHG